MDRSSFASAAARRKSIRTLVRENAAVRREQLGRDKALKKLRGRHRDYQFRNVTTDLAAVPGALEIHPQKGAPTLAEVRDEIARENDKERMKFFGVPIKVYDKDGDSLVPSSTDLTEEDLEELHRYGSRVVMSKAGHVVGLEVRKDIMKRFKPKNINADFCQCEEIIYDMSRSLEESQEVRRKFMARILVVETSLKAPVLGWLFMLHFIIPLFDFMYEQMIILLVFTLIFMVVRGIIVLFTGLIHIKHVQRSLLIMTGLYYCLGFSFATLYALQWYIFYLEFNQYEDPISLSSLKQKVINREEGSLFPYCSSLFVGFNIVQNLILIAILRTPSKMDEMKNGAFLLIFLIHLVLGALTVAVVFFSGIVATPTPWDAFQIGFAMGGMWKWGMWRFYMLQELLRGKLHDVFDHQHVLVALQFAFTFN